MLQEQDVARFQDGPVIRRAAKEAGPARVLLHVQLSHGPLDAEVVVLAGGTVPSDTSAKSHHHNGPNH